MNKQIAFYDDEDGIEILIAGHVVGLQSRPSAPYAPKPVVCEPCKNGGGPKQCVRPCVVQGGRNKSEHRQGAP